MIPWKLLDTAQTPGDGQNLHLYQRDTEFLITLGNDELMTSHMHGSEEALAKLACQRITKHPQARVLIGGLGMGYTLRSALNELGAKSQVAVAELVPSVVRWNREFLADLTDSSLDDSRVTIHEVDVALMIKASKGDYSAILLDVDNGPQAMTTEANDWLYSLKGLNTISAALQPKGVLAVWSSDPDAAFYKRLCEAGFEVDEIRVPAHGEGKVKRSLYHTIWTAIRF